MYMVHNLSELLSRSIDSNCLVLSCTSCDAELGDCVMGILVALVF